LLKVSTNPPHAKVIVDGSNRGLTPLEITLALGPHEVRFELDGHDVLTTKMLIEPGDNSFSSPLEPVKGVAKVTKTGATKPGGTTKTPLRETPTPTSTNKVLTVTGPTGQTGPIGPKPPIPEKIDPEIKKAGGSETKQPPEVKTGGGKGNPYTPAGTKGNPYTPNSK
jgi:hypothetical protein